MVHIYVKVLYTPSLNDLIQFIVLVEKQTIRIFHANGRYNTSEAQAKEQAMTLAYDIRTAFIAVDQEAVVFEPIST